MLSTLSSTSTRHKICDAQYFFKFNVSNSAAIKNLFHETSGWIRESFRETKWGFSKHLRHVFNDWNKWMQIKAPSELWDTNCSCLSSLERRFGVCIKGAQKCCSLSAKTESKQTAGYFKQWPNAIPDTSDTYTYKLQKAKGIKELCTKVNPSVVNANADT